ncbi:hypothetical protein PCIT_a3249 [Pseudoalteromonas citrea]|uniref:Uncharacterized protein n=1 Tax=Pseudoalteromonas citrea TaxID=43655 RepID=A0AAD4AGM2_9GAMM|nr:hypothetical protein PCIT_a3249 [Pseudoalteromonas citrea]
MTLHARSVKKPLPLKLSKHQARMLNKLTKALTIRQQYH